MADKIIEEEVRKFREAVEVFTEAASAIPEEQLLSKLNNWTPRDVIAHLIGWNRYLVQGAAQLMKGELPFYDLDPGKNYSKINAKHIHDYPSTIKSELLAELKTSATEVESMILSIDSKLWDNDFGVRHKGKIVTIHNSMDELTEDYYHHREQLNSFLGR